MNKASKSSAINPWGPFRDQLSIQLLRPLNGSFHGQLDGRLRNQLRGQLRDRLYGRLQDQLIRQIRKDLQ